MQNWKNSPGFSSFYIWAQSIVLNNWNCNHLWSITVSSLGLKRFKRMPGMSRLSFIRKAWETRSRTEAKYRQSVLLVFSRITDWRLHNFYDFLCNALCTMHCTLRILFASFTFLRNTFWHDPRPGESDPWIGLVHLLMFVLAFPFAQLCVRGGHVLHKCAQSQNCTRGANWLHWNPVYFQSITIQLSNRLNNGHVICWRGAFYARVSSQTCMEWIMLLLQYQCKNV